MSETPETSPEPFLFDSDRDVTRAFWHSFLHGAEVVVGLGGPAPDKIFGVRDGFERYWRETLRRPGGVSVQSRSVDAQPDPLPMSDEETLELARDRARAAEASAEYRAFAVGAETGLVPVRAAGSLRQVVRTWVVVVAPVGLAAEHRDQGEEAWGSSGSLELPRRLVDGAERLGSGTDSIPGSIPGTRRRGGMVASLTGGLETRRGAIALATFHAVTSLLYGRVGGPREGRPGRAPGLD